MHLYRFAQFAFVKYPLAYGKKTHSVSVVNYACFVGTEQTYLTTSLKNTFTIYLPYMCLKNQHCGLCYESLNTSYKVYLPYFEDIVLYNEIWNTLNVQYQQTLDFLMLNL